MKGEYAKEYIFQISDKYKTGQAREHAYRPALDTFFEKVSGFNVVNDPKRSEFGSPDFVFMRGKTTVAYAEAKDVDIPLDEVEKTEQMERYYGYSNIILTNYLEFRFYRNGQQYGDSIKIAELKLGAINSVEANFILAEDTIREFTAEAREPIKSGLILAKVMAWKGRRIRDNIKKFLAEENNAKNENLLSVYEVIKKLLLVDLDKQKFADMYAQTLVYGLFVARYYDDTPDDFSRQEARDLVPTSNPFLRHFFDHIAGSSFDSRIDMIVKELCEEFTHSDVQAIVHNYYKVEKDDSRDPIIHFYEDFLQEYDSAERKKMGVFYTPLPVVRFIVRSVDDILKNDFGLTQGIADISKTEIVKESQGKRFKVPVHKVQILDPATGTGTFLNEVILHIRKLFTGQEGRWSQYVNSDLLPRLHGFELMMASYTIAHLKLSSTITETGAKIENTRLGVYLTNSLEKGENVQKTLFDFGFGKAITEESNQANKVKSELPIMVVMGNPPYSGESSNALYTDNDVYKVEPTGGKLRERNSKWLNDDYVKFIRFAESMIEKTGEGIVAMITAHGYIDNPTFRGMRYHLMQTFDQIYVLNLHGNANKKEKSLDGSKDENVFAIKQGVAIFVGIKKTGMRNKKLTFIHRVDLYGLRKNKFDYLKTNEVSNVHWQEIVPRKPNYEWAARDTDAQAKYAEGFSTTDIFAISSVCIVSGKDSDFIKFSREEFNGDGINQDNIKSLLYRVFDTRFLNYDLNSITRARFKVMKNFANKNIGLTFIRNDQGAKSFSHIFVSSTIVDGHLHPGLTYVAPLYLYSEDGTRVSALKKEIVTKIEKVVGKTTPEDIFDYVYAILYSPSYREKYKEFLKIDFPRIPYPKSEKQFFELAKLGRELKELHLLESPELSKFITTYTESGDNKAENVGYKDGKVYINKTQYFGNVPEIAWNFYIGGYQPAQKWLKDRRGRILNNEDIEHYQKIIVVLVETDRIMKEIDSIFLRTNLK